MPSSANIAHPGLAAYAQAIRPTASEPSNNQQNSVGSFGDVLASSIDEAIDANRTSENTSIQAASGQSDLQDVVEAVNAAEISLQTVVSIRDRMISAYQEILRMPI